MKEYGVAKEKRTLLDKLYTLVYGKDLRITQGEPYTKVRPFDFSSYYPQEKYIDDNEIVPKDNVYDIREFGAVANDVNIDNAIFINKAFEEAERTSGTVLICGGEYSSSTVFIKSNTSLFIQYGNAIVAKENGTFYNRALIYGKKQENITLSGGGKLKGNGHLYGRKPYFDKNITKPDKYIDVIEMRRSYRAQLRFAHESKYGGLVNFESCNNVNIKNIVLENSAYWTLHMNGCNDVSVENVVINNNRNVANADGVDVVGGTKIRVKHCFISTADDGIVFKNAIWLGSNKEMSDIQVSDCEIISRTNAVKIGTETTYPIKDITVKNCTFLMPDLYPGAVSGISVESCDGSLVDNIKFENIKMDKCTCPIFIRLGNRNRAPLVMNELNDSQKIEFGVIHSKKEGRKNKSAKDDVLSKHVFNHKGSVSNIELKNIYAKEVELPVIIAGYRQRGIVRCVNSVKMDNIHITYANRPETVDKRLFIPQYAQEYPECWRFRNLPAYGLWARYAKNLQITNFICNHNENTWKKEKIMIHCS